MNQTITRWAPGTSRWLGLILACALSSPAQADPTVTRVNTTSPLDLRITGKFKVGAVVTGQMTQSDEAEFSTSESDNQSLTTKSLENTKRSFSTSTSNERTTTATPKPPPKPSSFLKGLVQSISTGSPAPMLGPFSEALDYSVAPVNRQWTRTTGFKRSNEQSSSSELDVQNTRTQGRQWANRTLDKFSSTAVTDLNGGYLRFGISLTNTGAGTLRIRPPLLAVYFNHVDGSADLVDIVRAKQTGAADQVVSIPPQGQADFKVAIEGLNIKELLASFGQTTHITVRIQDVTLLQGDQDKSLGELIEKESKEHVRLVVRSDNYSVNQLLKVSGPMTVKELLAAADLDADIDETAPTLTFALRGLNPDVNELADQKISQFSPASTLLGWRRWIVLIRNSWGTLESNPGHGKQIKPGYTVALQQLSAPDLLGDLYRPLVWAANDVVIPANEAFGFVKYDLQAGDVVVLSKIRVKYLTEYQVRYRRKDISSSFQQYLAGIQRTHVGAGYLTASGAVSRVVRTPPPSPGSPFAGAYAPEARLGQIYHLTYARAPLAPSPNARFVAYVPEAVTLHKRPSLQHLVDRSAFTSGMPIDEVFLASYVWSHLNRLRSASSPVPLSWTYDREFEKMEDILRGLWRDLELQVRIDRSIPRGNWHIDAAASARTTFVLAEPMGAATRVIPFMDLAGCWTVMDGFPEPTFGSSAIEEERFASDAKKLIDGIAPGLWPFILQGVEEPTLARVPSLPVGDFEKLVLYPSTGDAVLGLDGAKLNLPADAFRFVANVRVYRMGALGQ